MNGSNLHNFEHLHYSKQYAQFQWTGEHGEGPMDIPNFRVLAPIVFKKNAPQNLAEINK